MNIRYSFARAVDATLVLQLLPTLLEGDSVVVDPSHAALDWRCAASAFQAFEHQLTQALDAAHVPWVSEQIPDGEMLAEDQFYQLGHTALTAILQDHQDVLPKLIDLLLGWGVELCGMRRLSPRESGSESAFEFFVNGLGASDRYRSALNALSMQPGVDIVLSPSDSKRPRSRLFAFDMDSTLIRCEVIDELARCAGAGDVVAAITARAMRGELDFVSSFRERMASLQGLPETELARVAESLPIMPGARYLMRSLRAQGHYTVILSGGFDYFARHVQTLLGMNEIHANTLDIRDGHLSGDVVGEVVDGQRKVALLKRVASERGFSMVDTVAVGDGANDLPMLGEAGLGVAFHAKPLVRDSAKAAISHGDLSTLLYVLGVARLDVTPD